MATSLLCFLSNNTSFIIPISSIKLLQSWCQQKVLQNSNSYLNGMVASRVEQCWDTEKGKNQSKASIPSNIWEKKITGHIFISGTSLQHNLTPLAPNTHTPYPAHEFLLHDSQMTKKHNVCVYIRFKITLPK